MGSKNTNLKQPVDTKKLRTIKGTIIKAIKETIDTWSLNISVNKEDKDYLAGQFISIDPHQFYELRDYIKFLEYHKGKKEQIRAYSLSSAPHEDHITITIKPENFQPGPNAYPPLLSPFLASNMLVGREIEFLGYTGAYTMPSLDKEITDIVHLVAGSGMVPSFSIIKDELYSQRNPQLKHTVIYANQTFSDIIFHEELKELKSNFPHQLQVEYFLSKDKQSHGQGYHLKRADNLTKELIPNHKESIFFICGPSISKWERLKAQETDQVLKPKFMEWALALLSELGVNKKRIRREAYG